MSGLAKMHHLMHNDVLQALATLAGQICIETDVPAGARSSSSSGISAMPQQH